MTKNNIKVVSFDVEGTLVTTDFSNAIWFEMIPQLYAQKYGLPFADALARVKQKYAEVGDQRLEWYDVQYWFNRFGFGKAEIAMEQLQKKVKRYPDADIAMQMLKGNYRLNIASGSPRTFLKHLLRDVEQNFNSIFSSVSDYQRVKRADFYEEMCRELNVEPEQVVHVGDNYNFDVLEPGSIGIRAFFLDREGKTTDQQTVRNLIEFASILQ